MQMKLIFCGDDDPSLSLCPTTKGIGVWEYGAESINFGMSIHVGCRFSIISRVFRKSGGVGHCRLQEEKK